MKKLSLALSAVAAAAALVSAPAHALSVGSGWESFVFGGVGSSFSGTYSFTLSSSALLKVTDAFLSGDQFDVTDFGSSIGATSAPGSVGDQIGADYDGAYADARWSSGTYLLAAGSHSISGTVLLSPFGSGGAALELTAAPVPEPETYALMAGGLGLVAFMARRRKAAR